MTANKTLMCTLSAAAFALAAASVPMLAAASTPSHATKKLDGAQYLKEANITLVQARASAVKAYPGTIVVEELEKEGGGSGLRYSFDVKNGSVTHEVGIDAKTGSLLENSIEGPNAD